MKINNINQCPTPFYYRARSDTTLDLRQYSSKRHDVGNWTDGDYAIPSCHG